MRIKIKQFLYQKRMRFLLFLGFSICVIILPFFLHLFVPGGQALLDILCGKGVFGRRQSDLTIQVDGEKQHVRVYVANIYPDEKCSNKQRIVLLTGVALRNCEGKLEIVNWKVGRNFIGATHDHQAVFFPAWWGVIAGEGIHTTYPLEDDMKGSNAEYTIIDSNPFLNYTIEFPLGKGTKKVTFSIPQKWFGIKKTLGVETLEPISKVNISAND